MNQTAEIIITLVAVIYMAIQLMVGTSFAYNGWEEAKARNSTVGLLFPIQYDAYTEYKYGDGRLFSMYLTVPLLLPTTVIMFLVDLVYVAFLRKKDE